MFRSLLSAPLLTVGCLAAIAVGPPLLAQPTCDGTEAPYVFVFFDASGSTHWAPPCSAAQLAAGECDLLCPSGECFAALNGDDPSSKLHQMKSALHEAVSNHPDVLYGFASFNQDDLRVRDKHWLYTVSATQPDGSPNEGILLYSGQLYPQHGAEEVFGHTWACDEGSGIRERGCWSNSYRIADIADPWEVRRVRRLPKLGRDMSQTTTVYLRDVDGERYAIEYRPVPFLSNGMPNAYGNAQLAVEVEVGRCVNDTSRCTTDFVSRQVVYYDLISDFAVWDNGADLSAPREGFFFQSNSADGVATNTCAGWESNDDTVHDLYYAYTLRFPTFPDPPPLRFDTDGDGVLDTEDFSFGDVIPLDWADGHQTDVLTRLAPNTALDPLAAPDFRVATYLADARQPGEPYLRLIDEAARPIVGDGAAPIGAALRDFRDDYVGVGGAPGFSTLAAQFDPDFACREKIVILLADGVDSCTSSSLACNEAQALLNYAAVRTYAVGFGTSGSGDMFDCVANNGGTGLALRPQTRQELVDDLSAILD